MMHTDIDIMDINPIVNVGTIKTPMYILDATWMTVLYEKATGKDFTVNDDYMKFYDKFVAEFNKSNDLKLTIKKVMK
jgi:hypothetical protein